MVGDAQLSLMYIMDDISMCMYNNYLEKLFEQKIMKYDSI